MAGVLAIARATGVRFDSRSPRPASAPTAGLRCSDFGLRRRDAGRRVLAGDGQDHVIEFGLFQGDELPAANPRSKYCFVHAIIDSKNIDDLQVCGYSELCNRA